MAGRRRRRHFGGSSVPTQVVVNSFSQPLGSELFINGDFSSGTTGWTLGGGAAETAPDGSAGTGAVRITNAAAFTSFAETSATITLPANYTWVEFGFEITSSVAGTAFAQLQADGALRRQPSGARIYRWIERIQTSLSQAYRIQNQSAGANFVVDNLTMKVMTLNAIVAALNASGTFTFEFTLPVSPVAGQSVRLLYRIAASDQYYEAVVERDLTNANWQASVNLVNGNPTTGKTSKIAAVNCGTPDSIKMVVNGNSHSLYTGVAGVFTQRGSTFSDSTQNTQVNARVAYSSAVTPVRLTLDTNFT